jgi:putative flavoprotein involved in K+ transport
MRDAIVIGAGPGGLAAAAMLKRAGLSPLVLERAAAVAPSWRGHYDRLHLHTVRWLSGLPGLAIPRACGPWVARDQLVAYLEQYAQHHGLEVRFGTEVQRLERGLRVLTAGGTLEAARVVVATGYNLVPFLPAWPGAFTGELLHASRYQSGAAFRGKDVLVVGAGNTGAEIAVDLVEQGAARVRLAVRTPPNILPRAAGGLPTQALGILLRRLPARLVDAVAGSVTQLLVGDLSRYGLPRPARGAFTRTVEDGQIAILDVGLVALVKAEKIGVVGAVEAFDGPEVVLAGGARLRPDAVIAATGYRRGLEPLVGHLGVLRADGLPAFHGAATHPEVPGLHFIGYSNPVSGNLREIGIDARRIARAARRAPLRA